MLHAAVAHTGSFFFVLAFKLALVLGFYLVGFTIETVSGNQDPTDGSGTIFNSLHAIILIGADLSIGAMTAYCIKILIDKLPFYRPPIHIHSGVGLQSVALSVFAIVMGDFFYYWFHRLQHSSKWLWAEHELHHSDEHMNITTNSRHHFLEMVLQPLFIGLPFMLLFDPPGPTVVWIVLLGRAISYFNHLNSRIPFGWFNRVISTHQVHRIHHSIAAEHIDKNFATILPLWDIVFGTYCHPRAGEWPRTGVAGVKVDSFWQYIVMPFVSWKKMLASSFLVPSRWWN